MSQLASPQQPVSPFKNITDHIEFAVDEAIVDFNSKKPKKKIYRRFFYRRRVFEKNSIQVYGLSV